jgi:hypothetical protein
MSDERHCMNAASLRMGDDDILNFSSTFFKYCSVIKVRVIQCPYPVSKLLPELVQNLKFRQIQFVGFATFVFRCESGMFTSSGLSTISSAS